MGFEVLPGGYFGPGGRPPHFSPCKLAEVP